MKLDLWLSSTGTTRSLKIVIFWGVSLALWGVVFYLLYNLLYGRNGMMDYVAISNAIATMSNENKISDAERAKMEEKFQLTDKDGNEIELWNL